MFTMKMILLFIGSWMCIKIAKLELLEIINSDTKYLVSYLEN